MTACLWKKKPGFDNEARALLKDARSFLGVTNLTGLRLFNRYDVEGLDAALLMRARASVFSEPQLDDVYDELPQDEGVVFATEYLPGQFDQRADSAAQCIQLMAQCERPIVRTALVYILKGNLSDKDVETLKKHVIQPPWNAARLLWKSRRRCAPTTPCPRPWRSWRASRAMARRSWTPSAASTGWQWTTPIWRSARSTSSPSIATPR